MSACLVLSSLITGAATSAVLLSPFGRRSGGHFNPAMTLVYFRLGKVTTPDTVLYMASQFTGAVLGILVSVGLFGPRLMHPLVRFAFTVPAGLGLLYRFFVELTVGLVTMSAVLISQIAEADALRTAVDRLVDSRVHSRIRGGLRNPEIYLELRGAEQVDCGKLHHNEHSPCPFRCRIEAVGTAPE